MAIDKHEAKTRGQQFSKPKSGHPIAAIEKRVMDSAAHCHLTYSARSVLMVLCRNIEKDRNGHIQLSETQAAQLGIERKTLRRALKELIAHQLIAMTWRGGKVQGSCNKYALTWMPIKDRKGIECRHFKQDAWRDWQPSEKKTAYRKHPQDKPQNVPLKPISNPEMSPTPWVKMGHIEVIPVQVVSAASRMMYRSINPTHPAFYKPRFAQRQYQPLRC